MTEDVIQENQEEENLDGQESQEDETSSESQQDEKVSEDDDESSEEGEKFFSKADLERIITLVAARRPHVFPQDCVFLEPFEG